MRPPEKSFARKEETRTLHKHLGKVHEAKYASAFGYGYCLTGRKEAESAMFRALSTAVTTFAHNQLHQSETCHVQCNGEIQNSQDTKENCALNNSRECRKIN